MANRARFSDRIFHLHFATLYRKSQRQARHPGILLETVEPEEHHECKTRGHKGNRCVNLLKSRRDHQATHSADQEAAADSDRGRSSTDVESLLGRLSHPMLLSWIRSSLDTRPDRAAAEQIKTDISAYSCLLRFPRQLRHCRI